MATIPTLQNQVSDQAAPNFQVRPLQNTVGESLGQGVANVGAVVYKIQQEEQLKADRAAFMDADRQSDTAANDLITHSQELQGKDAIGSSPVLLKAYDESAAQIGAKLSKRAAAAYQESVNARRSSLQRQFDNHEGQQREEYYAKSREDYKDQAHINAVSNYTDPKAIEAEIAKVGSAIAQTPGMDDEQKATELGLRRAGIYAGVIDRYLANDQVGKARAYYATIKDGAAARASYIENRINDAAKALEARAKSQWAETQAGRVLSAYATEGPDSGINAMKKFEELAAKGKITREQLGDVYAKVQQGLNLARNAKQEEHADELAGLRQNLANKSTDLSDVQKVESLWKDNTLSPTERAAYIGQIEANHIEKSGSLAAAAAVQDALATGTPLSPSNSDHRKALAAAFGQDVSAVPVGSQQFQQLATAYAVKTRMLPTQATEWAQAAARSPNPQIAAQAAQFLGAVEASAPDAASGFDSDTKAFAGMINSMIAAGTDPTEAVNTARENVFDLKPQVAEARKKAYSVGKDALSLGSTGALNSYIDRDFDKSWFSSQPEASLDLKADFDSLTERYFLKTGDIAVARDNAWRDVKRAYGPSKVNGVSQLMLMPPEKFGVKPEEVRKDIGDFLTTYPQADGSAEADVIVVPDSRTMREVNNIYDGQPVSPSYRLVGKSGDLLVGKDGVPQRFFLPNGEEFAARVRKEQAEAQAVAQKQVDEARANRDVSKATELILRTGGLH